MSVVQHTLTSGFNVEGYAAYGISKLRALRAQRRDNVVRLVPVVVVGFITSSLLKIIIINNNQ